MKKKIETREDYLKEIAKQEGILAETVRQSDYRYCLVQKQRKKLERMYRTYKKLLITYKK